MMFLELEANQRLDIIKEMAERSIKDDTLLAGSEKLLNSIVAICKGEEATIPLEKIGKTNLDRVIISCDASIKNNPGGPSSIAAIIEYPEQGRKPSEYSEIGSSTTSNQAEYEAIYWALMTYFNKNNNPTCLIEVRSDSKLVVSQILGEMECNDPSLKNKRDAIREFVAELPVPVSFRWMPRCSTPELKLANYLAQDVLGVSRH